MRRLLLALALLLTLGIECAEAFTWRTSTRAASTGTTTFSVTEPTGITSGDFEFCTMATNGNGATISTPAGWTQQFTAAGSNTRVYVFVVTGGRGGSAPTLSFVSTTTGNEWHCGAFGGSNVTIDASTNGTMLTASTTQPDPPAATAVQTTDEAVAFAMNFNGTTATATAPSGYTLRSVTAAGLDIAFASKDLAASGSENPAAFAGWGTTANDVWGGTILVQSSGGAGATSHPCSSLRLLGVGCEATP